MNNIFGLPPTVVTWDSKLISTQTPFSAHQDDENCKIMTWIQDIPYPRWFVPYISELNQDLLWIHLFRTENCTPQRIVMEWGLVAVPQSRSQKTCTQVLGRNECWGLSHGFFLWGWQSRSFVLCLQEEKNSLLWLIVALSGLNKMKYFSVRHSRHILLTGLKPGACASCLNLIEYWTFWSFKSQMYFYKQVAVLFAFVSVLKLALWLFHLDIY